MWEEAYFISYDNQQHPHADTRCFWRFWRCMPRWHFLGKLFLSHIYIHIGIHIGVYIYIHIYVYTYSCWLCRGNMACFLPSRTMFDEFSCRTISLICGPYWCFFVGGFGARLPYAKQNSWNIAPWGITGSRTPYVLEQVFSVLP